MFAAEWGTGEVLLSMLYFFLFFMVIWIWIMCIADLFRDHEMGGAVKVIWVLVLIFLPLLGCLIYLIARGPSMSKRAMQQQAAAKAEFDQYVQQQAAVVKPSTTDELAKLASLKDAGTLSQEEFDQAKAKLLA